MFSFKTRLPLISGLALWAMLGYVPAAHAYLDPGTGSMMLQAIVGAIAGFALVGRLYWSKIKGFFLRREDKLETNEGASDDS